MIPFQGRYSAVWETDKPQVATMSCMDGGAPGGQRTPSGCRGCCFLSFLPPPTRRSSSEAPSSGASSLLPLPCPHPPGYYGRLLMMALSVVSFLQHNLSYSLHSDRAHNTSPLGSKILKGFPNTHMKPLQIQLSLLVRTHLVRPLVSNKTGRHFTFTPVWFPSLMPCSPSSTRETIILYIDSSMLLILLSYKSEV